MDNFKTDRERWMQLSFFDQMGSIGSEVGRAIRAKRSGKDERLNGAIARAPDLFDAITEQLAKEKSPHLREILRARNEFLRLFYDGAFEAEAESIERYFTLYAIAANKLRANK